MPSDLPVDMPPIALEKGEAHKVLAGLRLDPGLLPHAVLTVQGEEEQRGRSES